MFLGFTFRAGKLRWSQQAFEDFKHRVRELTGRSWGVSMRYRLDKLAQYVRGWMGYFGISQYYRPVPELDEWLRRRVRMCYWKQWRLCAHQGAPPPGAGHRQARSDPDGDQQQELLAPVADAGNADGND